MMSMLIREILILVLAMAFVVLWINFTDWAIQRFGFVRTAIARMLFLGVVVGAFYFTA